MNRRDAAVDLGRTYLRRLRRRVPGYGYIGWVGHGNLGDDSMYRAARLLSGENIDLIGSASKERVLHLLGAGGPHQFRRVLLGGGTLINQGYLAIVEECLRQGHRVSTLGTGVGSAGFSMPEMALDPRWVQALQGFEHVGVRGPVSLEKLERSGVKGAEIVGDLALVLTTDKPIADWGARSFLFNAAPPTSREDGSLFSGVFSSLARLLRRLARSGWSVMPVAFHPHDRTAIEAVLADSGIASGPTICPTNHAEYFSIATSASMSIGIRLHSSVLASCCGLPNILIGYRDKCADFASSVGMGKSFVSAATFDERSLFDAVDAVIARPDGIGAALHAECAGWKNVIREYFDRLARD